MHCPVFYGFDGQILIRFTDREGAKKNLKYFSKENYHLEVSALKNNSIFAVYICCLLSENLWIQELHY